MFCLSVVGESIALLAFAAHSISDAQSGEASRDLARTAQRRDDIARRIVGTTDNKDIP